LGVIVAGRVFSTLDWRAGGGVLEGLAAGGVDLAAGATGVVSGGREAATEVLWLQAATENRAATATKIKLLCFMRIPLNQVTIRMQIKYAERPSASQSLENTRGGASG
jgi:hypothetical protein